MSSRAERADLVAWAGAVALVHLAFAVSYRVDSDAWECSYDGGSNARLAADGIVRARTGHL